MTPRQRNRVRRLGTFRPASRRLLEPRHERPRENELQRAKPVPLRAEGRVAALVVAGGQGTRLGHAGPKGTFPLGPVSGRTLFGLQAEKLRGSQRRTGATPCPGS